LQGFYPSPQSLDPIAQRVVQSGALQTLASNWKIPLELAMDLVKISLFDVVVLCDDSGSMKFEQGGERIQDLTMSVNLAESREMIVDSQDPLQGRLCLCALRPRRDVGRTTLRRV
jgi:hypothetical protein